MRKSLLSIIILVLLVSMMYGTFVFSEYSAIPETNRVSIVWKTATEAGVARFVLLRSPDDAYFVQIQTIESNGQSSDYKYVDEDVFFKDSQTFFYKIRALGADNSVIEETESFWANPNISGIFKTWGTLKAIFGGR